MYPKRDNDDFFIKIFLGSYIFIIIYIIYALFEVKKKIWPKEQRLLLSALANTVNTIANITSPPEFKK